MINFNYKLFNISLCVNTLLISFSHVLAENYTIRATVQDFASKPVSEADFVVLDEENNPYYGTTDSEGKLSITVVISTGVGDEAGSSISSDFLEGIRYNLASTHGKITVFNVLGQRVKEYDLRHGANKLDIDHTLPAGRYFILMETPNYKAISSFTIISGTVVGFGPVKVMKHKIIQQHVFNKSNLKSFTLQGSKSGYESIEVTFDPTVEFTSYDEMILMNKIPSLSESLPDTLWHGFNLNHYIDNDDGGIWDVDTDLVDISMGIISSKDTTQDFITNLNITYADSVNPNLTIDFNSIFRAKIHQKTALVLVVEVVESGEWLSTDELELAFILYRSEVIAVLADYFQIDPCDMDNMTLKQIEDVYGEEWQINELKKVANPYYKKIIALTDEEATFENLIDSLNVLASSGYIIDMMFTLHGSPISVSLYESPHIIDYFTTTIDSYNIPLRSLYQTCCYGSDMIDEWEDIGIVAVSGAKGGNSLAVFSPIYFLQGWTTGMTFENAVQTATQREIDKIMSYKSTFPLMEYYITDELIDGSTQNVGGANKGLIWNDFARPF